MKLVELKGITFVEGGVCAAKGFRANGVQCGLAHKPLGDMAEANAAANNAIPTAKKKNDLALIVADKECSAAAVYTTNKVKGAPILVTKEHLRNGKARAVIVNSVNANTCNPPRYYAWRLRHYHKGGQPHNNRRAQRHTRRYRQRQA